ncbi:MULTISPECIES: BON domain-containing protein [Roseateles]|uniref:BON domain-containing protein n=1 Tax=Roseateles albus TaxID=2987525 RepID=A0ABT5K9T9_9BURK|nr:MULTISPECIES: BON domain-containing protein [Roseateles]MCV2360738.1 BON domain-containing protein [Paucibacter sp. TC2R-5]MDC8770204.1 BON domain-containing protein [Roseateles albus]
MNSKHHGFIPFLFTTAFTVSTMLVGGCSKPAEVAPTAPPTPAAVAQAASAAPGNVADADVSEHVATVLNQSDSLKTFDIKVVTLKGDVRLIGILDTQAQIDTALKLAREAEGTHTIHNELTLKQ